MDDDLYPNDSFYFPREPLDQVIGRKKEQAQVLEGKKELQQAVERLQDQIDFYRSVDAIPDAVRLDPTKFMTMHNAHTQVVEILKVEKEYLQDLLSSHVKD
jgi:hypothetical protein